MKTFQFRFATERDVDALVNLEQATFDTDRFTRKQIASLLAKSHAFTIVACDGAAIIGAACVLWRRSRSGARLYNLAVHPSRQGQGLGARLLTKCECEAVTRGCQRMFLEVRIDNHGGIEFYKRHGYVVVRTIRAYYEDGTAGLKMSKVLDVARLAESRLTE